MKKANNNKSFWRSNLRFGQPSDIPNPKSAIGHPLSILAFFTLFSTILTAQPIYKTYPNTNGGTAIGEYNNGANYLINTCTGNQATYLWTDGQGNLLNSESDFAGSCGQYRVDANTYIKADTVGTEPNRDIRFRKIARNGAVILEKIYPQALDNFGQFVSPTKDGGFIIAGNTQVTTDTLYRVQLTKIDVNGNLQWHKTVIVPNLNYSNAFIPNRTSCNQAITAKTIYIKEVGQASDGGFYLTYYWTDVTAPCGFGYRNGEFIIRTNATGDFMWQKGKNTSEIFGVIGYKILPTDNGSLYVLDSRVGGAHHIQTFYTYYFRKIAANGDTLWTFSGQRNPPLVEGATNRMHSFSLSPDNNIIAHTTETILKDFPGVEKSIIKLNAQTGRFIDSFSIPLIYNSKAIIPTKDNGFALVGGIGYYNDTTSFFYKDKFGIQTPPQYCASKSVAPWEYAISNVKLGALNITSDKFKDINTLGYSDYTNLGTTITKGQTYPLSITPLLSWIGNLPNVYCRVWIDFNQNKTFEADELVLERTNANPLTANVLIPQTALTGATRMRVSLKNGSYPTACEAFEKGEVEDYLVTIQLSSNTCFAVNCPPNITVNTTTNSAIATWTEPTLSGTSCGGSVFSTFFRSGSTFPLGTTNVDYSVVSTSDGTSSDRNCRFNVTVVNTGGGTSDIALTLTATPSVYRQYTTQNFKITAKNSGTTVFSTIKIKYTRPNLTVNGGTKVASIGTFQDFCAGGIECSEWTIPTLAAGTTATLDIPVFVLNPTGGITATAALLSSNPVDNNTANNTASVTINSANATLIQPLNQLIINSKPTQLIPVIIQKIAPTITENYIVVELESIVNKTIDFEISNSLGSVVSTEKIVVAQGTNKFHFQVENLPKGMYFIQTSVGKGRNVPMKFVKY